MLYTVGLLNEPSYAMTSELLRCSPSYRPPPSACTSSALSAMPFGARHGHHRYILLSSSWLFVATRQSAASAAAGVRLRKLNPGRPSRLD